MDRVVPSSGAVDSEDTRPSLYPLSITTGDDTFRNRVGARGRVQRGALSEVGVPLHSSCAMPGVSDQRLVPGVSTASSKLSTDISLGYRGGTASRSGAFSGADSRSIPGPSVLVVERGGVLTQHEKSTFVERR